MPRRNNVATKVRLMGKLREEIPHGAGDVSISRDANDIPVPQIESLVGPIVDAFVVRRAGNAAAMLECDDGRVIEFRVRAKEEGTVMRWTIKTQ